MWTHPLSGLPRGIWNLNQAEKLLTMHICVSCAQEREDILLRIADVLESKEEEIMQENTADVNAAEGKIDEQLMNRLRLKPQKIRQLGDGIRSIARQEEPIGRVSLCLHLEHRHRA